MRGFSKIRDFLSQVDVLPVAFVSGMQKFLTNSNGLTLSLFKMTFAHSLGKDSWGRFRRKVNWQYLGSTLLQSSDHSQYFNISVITSRPRRKKTCDDTDNDNRITGHCKKKKKDIHRACMRRHCPMNTY